MLSWLRNLLIPDQRSSDPESPDGDGTNLLPEEVYHDAAQHFLDVQISTHDLLDNKTSQTLSVGSVVLPVTFVLLNLSSRDVPVVALWALGLALGSYIALLVCAGRAGLIRGVQYRPDIKTLRNYSNQYSANVLKRWVADEYLASIDENKHVLITKARWVGAAWIALLGEAFFLSAAALTTVLL